MSDPRHLPSVIAEALKTCRSGLLGFAVFSLAANLLMLAGPLYMLQIYDRVLTSRSVPTLVALSLLLLGAYVVQGVLDVIRGRMVGRVAGVIDGRLERAVHRAVVGSQQPGMKGGENAVRDLDQIRTFLLSAGPISIADLPWMPIFLAICFLLHPLIGLAALAGAVVLVVVTLLTERSSRAPGRVMAAEGGVRQMMAESHRRNGEAISAMAMGDALAARWSRVNQKYLDALESSNDVVSAYGGVSKVVRMLIQSGILGLGAYLAINGQLSAGSMIAASIMMARALAPIEGVIANWRSFTGARQGARRLNAVLAASTAAAPSIVLDLPAPRRQLTVESLAITPPGNPRVIVRDVTLSLDAGEALAVIGASGSGKSSLGRALIGVWPAASGAVRIDGASLRQWRPEALGRHIGYVPQSIELFEGTVAENIARMSLEPDSAKVLEASRVSGAHDMILRLPGGYETQVGEGGANLSAGQRQRVALARALYGDPFLLVLDEPNSNLDNEGETALLEAVRIVKERGGAVVMIAHRPGLLAVCDKVLFLADGAQRAFGQRDEVLRRILARPEAKEGGGALKVVGSDVREKA
ncbi:MAG: type I secretion system permease/ATPase [Bauldia sp.]|nr:type I secretion system permease/ATPase [Bauldia sp.]